MAELSVFEKCFCVLIFLKKGTEGNPVFPSACFYVFVERKAELTCSAQWKEGAREVQERRMKLKYAFALSR